MDSDTMDAAYHDSRFTAEISKRMQVPDRIAIGGQEIGAGDTQNGISNAARGGMNDSEHAASLKMQVPERILVAGGNSHVAAKNLPRELQLENSVLSPSPEQIIAPPNSIRLNEHPFPTVGQDKDELNCTKENTNHITLNAVKGSNKVTGTIKEENSRISVLEESLSVYHAEREDELRDARRQIAQLNRRLVGLEVENRELQQRELLIGLAVCGYMFKKVLEWIFQKK